MNRIVYRVVLYRGRWKRRASPSHVREQMQRAFGRAFGSVEFHAPFDDDVAVDSHLMLFGRASHDEHLRDRVFEALIARLGPEYDSMVEVEVLDE